MKTMSPLHVFLGLIIFSGACFAQYAAQTESESGFYANADINIGLGSGEVIGDGENESTLGLGLSLRPGYQINEQWIGMLDLFWSFYSKDQRDVTLSGFMFSGQHYFMEEAYIRPAIGFSKIKTERVIAGRTLIDDSNLGIAFGVAGGYEYPINEMFKVGPTARILYNRINPEGNDSGSNFWNISAGIEVKASF